MSPISFFSTHTGAGGSDCGAIAAGLTLVGGIELDPYPVELYRNNFGDHIRHESILDTPIENLPDFDFLWSSPSCQKFSGSNRNGGESPVDVAISNKVAEIIRCKQPRYFALENVRQYLYKPKSKEFTDSFSAIIRAIQKAGYSYSFGIYNALDFGIPQDRDRLILRASLEPLLPLMPTHSYSGSGSFNPWANWFDAIKDFLPSCKDTFLTENQLKTLRNKAIRPSWPNGNYLLERVGYGKRGPIVRQQHEPVWTIRAMSGCDEKDGARSPATALLADGSVKALDYRCIAALQGFPKDYKWGERNGPNYKAAGNAIPVAFAEQVIRSMRGRGDEV